MAFIEESFPIECIDRASAGGVGFAVTRIHQDSGQKFSILRRPGPLWQYDLASTVKVDDNSLITLLNFIVAVGDSGFRFRDPIDFATDQTWQQWKNSVVNENDQQFATGDGTTTTFQLIKRYTVGTQSYQRPITKVNQTNIAALAAIDGVPQTNGVNFTVDDTSGLITFTTAPAPGSILTWGGEFDVPVCFTEETLLSAQTTWEIPREGRFRSLALEEQTADVTIPVEEVGGGSFLHSAMAASVSFTLVSGRAQVFQPTVAGLTAQAPLLASLPTGAPIFYVTNVSAAESIDVIAAENAAVIVTLAPGQTNQLLITLDINGDPQWTVF